MSQLDGDPDDLDNQGMTHSQEIANPNFYAGSGNFGGTKTVQISSLDPLDLSGGSLNSNSGVGGGNFGGNSVQIANSSLPISQVSIPTLSTEPASTVDITATRLVPPISQPTNVLDNSNANGLSVTSLMPTASASATTSTTGSSGLIIIFVIIAALYLL